MLKIKLSRVGKRSQSHYRIVVSERRSKRDGSHVEIIGFYNPLTDPATVTLDFQKYTNWLEKGAQPTPTVSHLVKSIKSPKTGNA